MFLYFLYLSLYVLLLFCAQMGTHKAEPRFQEQLELAQKAFAEQQKAEEEQAETEYAHMEIVVKIFRVDSKILTSKILVFLRFDFTNFMLKSSGRSVGFIST